MKKFKKCVCCFGLLFLITLISISMYANDIQVFGFWGTGSISEYGSEKNYILGENDFPVTPSHNIDFTGLGILYYFNNNIGIELLSKYFFTTELALEDPSDGDTVRINTSNHFSVSLNLFYEMEFKTFKPYLFVGGGFDKLFAEEKEYISNYGYKITFLPPERTIDPMFNIGIGFKYFFVKNFGLRAGLDYVQVFTKNYNIKSFNLYAGLLFNF